MKVTVDDIISLAREVEIADPIDWGMLAIDEDEAYKLIALNIVEIFKDTEQSTRELSLLAMIVKLTVENFVLNVKLLQQAQ